MAHGERAPGVRGHLVAMHDDLWNAAAARAKREGIPLSEVVRRKLAEYVSEPEAAGANDSALN